MTTATIEKQDTAVEYQEFTWQAVKALAEKIGVPYYAAKDMARYQSSIGFALKSYDKTRIDIEGHVPTSNKNESDSRNVYRYSREAFLLKLELYFLKNNIKYEYVEREPGRLYGSYIRIVK